MATPCPGVTNDVTGLVGTITDVNLTLSNYSHDFPDDVDVMLVSPSGVRVIVMSDVGGGSPLTNVSLVLDDHAAADLPDNAAISAGTFRPTNIGTGDPFTGAPSSAGAGSSLAALNGTDGNGVWSLYVVDDAGWQSGSVAGWSLAITTSGESVYPSTIAVSGAQNGVTDINVTLTGLSHTFPSDIDMLLVGPGGQQATILSDSGGGSPGGSANLVLDDAAAAGVPAPLTSGTFKPTNPGASADTFAAPAPTATGSSALSVFNGTNPNGTWSLYVIDDGTSDRGALTGWSLQIATVDQPAPPVITAPATGSRDRDGAFAMTGTVPASTTVKIYDGATLKTTVAASATGQWTANIAGIPNGPHTFTATATDGLGNTSAASAGVVVTVDSIKPAIVSTKPARGALKASRTANVTALATEAVRPLTVTKANAFIVVAGTTTHLKAKVSWRAATRTIVINPKANLAHGTKYKVTITTAVLDLAGNPLDQNKAKAGLQKKTWKFTTR